MTTAEFVNSTIAKAYAFVRTRENPGSGGALPGHVE